MKLIVGLGNPGKEYADTRHNVGFLVVDALAGDAIWSQKKAFKGAVADFNAHDEKIFLLKPLTYMNLSGESVRALADFYKIAPQDIILVHDDLDIAFGKILVKAGQRAAGHNGVQSVIDNFGGVLDFTRVRIGIGRPENPEFPVEDWVVSQWGAEEKEKLPAVVDEAVVLTKKFLFDTL